MKIIDDAKELFDGTELTLFIAWGQHNKKDGLPPYIDYCDRGYVSPSMIDFCLDVLSHRITVPRRRAKKLVRQSG